MLAASGTASLLSLGEREWRSQVPPGADRSQQIAALLIYAHRQVTALAEGEGGWDSEYSRDTWRPHRLGLAATGQPTLRFSGIIQPWLKDLAKRWARSRISAGLSMHTCYHGIRAVTRFSALRRPGRRPGPAPGRPGAPGTLPGQRAPRAGRKARRPQGQRRRAEHVPAGDPQPRLGRVPSRHRDVLPRRLPEGTASGCPGRWPRTS